MHNLLLAFTFIGALTACGLQSGDSVSATTTYVEPLTESTAGGSDGEAMVEAYVTDVCRVYADATCIDSQKSTCPTAAVFASEASCLTSLRGMAAQCEGLAKAMETNRSDVEACRTKLRATTCDEATPFCDASGKRLDATGSCAKVHELVAACSPKADTGL